MKRSRLTLARLRRLMLALALMLTTLLMLAPATPALAAPPGGVVAWGNNDYGQSSVPTGLSGVTALAAGGFHSLALKSDGTVVAWGNNDYGQSSVPAGLSGVTALAGGGYHSLALKSDGTVVAWGNNGYGQSSVPAGLSGVTALAGGGYHSLALKSDGTVVAWGLNGYGQLNIPAGLSGVTALAGGGYHNLALKSDGTVVAWGYNADGQSSVPAGLSGVTALAGGGYHNLALKSDGTVVAWGYNADGQSSVPAGLSGVTAIAAGFSHNLALKSDGTVVAWGYNADGQSSVPAGLRGVTALAAGFEHSLAIKSDDIAPTVTLNQAPGQADPTNTAQITFDVRFSESVTGFDDSDISFAGSTAGGALVASVSGTGASYTVVVSGMTSNGAVVISVPAGAAADAAMNASLASTSIDNTVFFDTIAPTVIIDQPVGQADPTSNSPISFDFFFSEPVNGFDAGDVILSGNTGATKAVVSGSLGNYTVSVSGMTTDGIVGVGIAANAATDAAGNGNADPTSIDNTVVFIVDNSALEVTLSSASPDPTNATPIPVTAQFNKHVTGFTASDIIATNATVGNFVVVDSATYTFDLTPSAQGVVSAFIPAGVARDAVGIPNAAMLFSRMYDTIAPRVTINQASGQSDPTGAPTINFEVLFSEPVIGFNDPDVTVIGTAGGVVLRVIEQAPFDGTSYLVEIGAPPASGTIIANIAPNTVADAAGNGNSASISSDNTVTFVNDSTAPVITPTVSGTLGSNGWYISDVTVSWSVVDTESAISAQTGCGSSTVNSDTSGTTLTCSATSAGGASSQSVTIKRDATAPDTIIGNTFAATTTSTLMIFSFAGNDVTSGRAGFQCSLDGAAFATCFSPLALTNLSTGSHTFQVRTLDNAGNVDPSPASATWVVLSPDTTPPAASPTQSPAANTAGWNNSDVTVAWNWFDPSADSTQTSGIDAANCTTNSASSSEGTLALLATCKDLAGNSGTATYTVNVDKTAPVASAIAAPIPNSAGWNNTNVTISFSGTDATSGIATCSSAVTFSSDGADQSASGTCTDVAGNVSAPATLGGIKIDKTAPTLAPSVSPNPVLLGGSATASPNASDALSGIASASCGALNTSSVGTKSVTCTASDNAGNTSSATVNYSVIYAWAGFFQPIDNLPTLNSVKAGQAIPIKFSLGGDFGLNIFAAGYPISQQVACSSGAPIDDIEQTVTAGASSLSYDPTTQQYSYTWKTDKSWANTCRQLTVRLVDGTDHVANFKFK